MNESTLTCSFQLSGPSSDKDISEITFQISELEGVKEVNVSNQFVTITFNGYVQTKEIFRQKLKNAGYTVLDDSRKSEGWFQKLVRYITKGNKEAFKDGKPDCCNPKIPENKE